MKLFATVFHGSGSPFESIDLSFGAGAGLEFGAGFYTTLSESLALEYALLAIQEQQLDVAYVHTFDFDAELALAELDAKVFDGITVDWFKYVGKNIATAQYESDFDIVVGSLESELAWKLLREYESGKIPETHLVSSLANMDFDIQIAFKTTKSLNYLSNHRITAIHKESQ
jgi:hypothetical protein